MPLTPERCRQPADTSATQSSTATAQRQCPTQEQSNVRAPQAAARRLRRRHGFAKQVQTLDRAAGLVVRVLTDKLLFASGQARLIPPATRC